MYRIRFHGRGGQGMKTASRILGTAFFNEGFEVQDAPRYGAERRGAPIFAYVRAARKPIEERGIIRFPDLVICADDSLVAVPAAGVLTGLTSHAVLLINSHDEAAQWRHRLGLDGNILILPAAEEIEDRAEMRFVGAVCAGAGARLTGAVSADAIARAIRTELAHLGGRIVNHNLDRALDAYEQMAGHEGCVTELPVGDARDWQSPGWVDLTLEDADISAPIIHGALTSGMVATGSWRTMRPVIDYEHCNRCWWVCSTFCPDGAITVAGDGRPQIDYDHCKGCLICVAQCPPHAVAAIPEHQAAAAHAEKGS